MKGSKRKKMDKNLICKDCGSEFVFTNGEQEFYGGKGFIDPVRCPDCRRIKKDSKKNEEQSN